MGAGQNDRLLSIIVASSFAGFPCTSCGTSISFFILEFKDNRWMLINRFIDAKCAGCGGVPPNFEVHSIGKGQIAIVTIHLTCFSGGSSGGAIEIELLRNNSLEPVFIASSGYRAGSPVTSKYNFEGSIKFIKKENSYSDLLFTVEREMGTRFSKSFKFEFDGVIYKVKNDNDKSKINNLYAYLNGEIKLYGQNDDEINLNRVTKHELINEAIEGGSDLIDQVFNKCA